MKKECNHNLGFSIVELLVVVAIMAVLTGLLVPTLIRYVKKTHEQLTRTNLKSMERELNDEYNALEGEITDEQILAVLVQYEEVTVNGDGTYHYEPKKGVPCDFSVTEADRKMYVNRLN